MLSEIKNIKRLLIFFAIVILSLQKPISGVAEEATSPIIVCLDTEAKLIPVYLTRFDSKESSFSPEYHKQLEKILQFDLSNNGMTSIVPSTSEREGFAKAEEFNIRPSDSSWKALGAYYVIKIKVNNKQLSARLFSANSDNVKSVDNIELTGLVNSDRKKIHQLSDTLHRALFNTRGIASTKILYTIKNRENNGAWCSELWECDYDGANAHKLSLSESGYVVTPVYMPPKTGFNSGTVFYVSYQTGQPKIYYQSLTENALPRRLNLMRGNQLMPAISRARDKIAFICDLTGNPDLFIQPFNPEGGPLGKPYQIFSARLATQGSPAFSPDGTRIAFVSNKDGSARIYVMDVPAPGISLKDIKAKLLTKCNKESSAPAWSPDGTKLAYCSMVKGVRQIWVYDFTTKEEKQLTQGPNNKENPTWAPNSLHLAFNTSDTGSCELFMINLNQPNAIKISSGAGEKRFPSWEPRSE